MDYDKPTPNSRKKRHYYLAVITLVYLRSEENEVEQVRQKTVNVVLEASEKLITMPLIEQARRGAVHRVKTELEAPDLPIKELIIQNLIYMGLMSPETMQGQVAS